MPLIENDVIFAYLNEDDPEHVVADRIFEKLINGEIELQMSSVSLIEMELIYRSEGRDEDLLEDLSALASLPNVEYVPLTPDIAIASVHLRQTVSLTFFDSHYAAAALSLDRKVVSFDDDYDQVPGLVRISPETI